MAAPLDEKARDAALAAWFANTAQGWHAAMEAAIRAYLAASPSPSEMEVVSFDGVAKRKLDGLLERGWKVSGYALHQDGDHGLITTGGFVGWFSVAERNDADARAKLEAAEARIKALEEALRNSLACGLPDVVAAAAPSNPVISDEMVERGAIALAGYDWETCVNDRPRWRDESREVLTAALSVKPQSDK